VKQPQNSKEKRQMAQKFFANVNESIKETLENMWDANTLMDKMNETQASLLPFIITHHLGNSNVEHKTVHTELLVCAITIGN